MRRCIYFEIGQSVNIWQQFDAYILGATLYYCNNNTGRVCDDAKENKDLQKAAEVEWEAIYCELQRLLRYGVTHASLPPGAADKYFISGNDVSQ